MHLLTLQGCILEASTLFYNYHRLFCNFPTLKTLTCSMVSHLPLPQSLSTSMLLTDWYWFGYFMYTVFIICDWLISLNIISLKFIHLLHMPEFISFPFKGWTLVYQRHASHFVYPLICWWYLGCFQQFDARNEPTINRAVQVTVWVFVIILLTQSSELDALDHMAMWLMFWLNSILFLTDWMSTLRVLKQLQN